MKLEADWDLTDLTRGLDFWNRASFGGDYGLLREACSMVIEFTPSSAADLVPFAIGGVQEVTGRSS